MIKKICTLNIELELLTGLHIGGYESTFDIGGADSSVIKDPLTKRPYIPGSSLKGKLKTLLTYRYNHVADKKIEISDPDILNLFQSVIIEDNRPSVTRALFRDLNLTEKSAQQLEELFGKGIYTEIKAENVIDKFKVTAQPRFIERVPAGAVFEGKITLTIFDGDSEGVMKNAIDEALQLLELNYLGGSGSRGYGRVKILKKEWLDENI